MKLFLDKYFFNQTFLVFLPYYCHVTAGESEPSWHEVIRWAGSVWSLALVLTTTLYCVWVSESASPSALRFPRPCGLPYLTFWNSLSCLYIIFPNCRPLSLQLYPASGSPTQYSSQFYFLQILRENSMLWILALNHLRGCMIPTPISNWGQKYIFLTIRCTRPSTSLFYIRDFSKNWNVQLYSLVMVFLFLANMKNAQFPPLHLPPKSDGDLFNIHLPKDSFSVIPALKMSPMFNPLSTQRLYVNFLHLNNTVEK